MCPELRTGASQIQFIVFVIITLVWLSLVGAPQSLQSQRAAQQGFQGHEDFQTVDFRIAVVVHCSVQGRGPVGLGSSPGSPDQVGVSPKGEVGSWHLSIWGHCLGFHFKGLIFRCLSPPPVLTISRICWARASGLSGDSILQGGRGSGFLSWGRTQSGWGSCYSQSLKTLGIK